MDLARKSILILWKRIYLRYLLKRGYYTKKSRIRRGNGRKNLKLKAIGIGCGDECTLGKRKTRQWRVELNYDRVKKKRNVTGVYDRNADIRRIPELPESIIEQIFTSIHCTKEMARNTIVSKDWKRMFDSNLTFDFDERWFRKQRGRGKHNYIKAREVQKRKFRNYVEKAIAKRLDPVTNIDKFRLYADNVDRPLTDCMVRWIRTAVDKNVKELDIQVYIKGMFFLTDSVLESTSIISLKLSGPILYDFKLSNLRELSIKDTTLIRAHVIKRFEEGCPLLEDVRLVRCSGSLQYNLTISSLLKLRRLEVQDCAMLSRIEIAASNLESFWYHAKKNQHCKIDLKGPENLKTLTLKDRKMTDSEFKDFISKCPLLEKLVLHECTSLEKLTISSGKLKSLALIQCVKLYEANIEAPNLYSFQYSGDMMPFPSMNASHLREVKFSFGPNMKSSQCIKYQNFFGNFDASKGFKLIVYSKQKMKIFVEPREANLVRNNFHKLELTASSASVGKIVDNWLWECHGKSLILISPSSELIKLIRTMIMDREDNPSCCRFYSNKCWGHYLADVRILTLKTAHKTRTLVDSVSLAMSGTLFQRPKSILYHPDKSSVVVVKLHQLRASIPKFKICGLRGSIPRLPRFPDRMPCIFSSSRELAGSRLFFPITRQSYILDTNLRDYSIIGQAIPHRGEWVALLQQRQVVLYNGRRAIPLRNLPTMLTGYLMASFIGQPEGGCEVLVVAVEDNFVRSLLYNPVLNRWTHRKIRDCGYAQRPMGHVTTSTHLLWVDTEHGCLCLFKDYWGSPAESRLHIATLGPLAQHADMVSIIVREDEFHSIMIFRDDVFRLYTLNQRISNEVAAYELIPLTLSLGENVFACSFRCGLFTASHNPHGFYDRSRMIYLGSWIGDCTQINLDGAPQEGMVIKQCYAPGFGGQNGWCMCRSYIFLLDEYSFRGFQI